MNATIHTIPLASFKRAIAILAQSRTLGTMRGEWWKNGGTRKKLRALRENKRISAHVFADILGYSENTLRGWETGRLTPSPFALKIWRETLESP